MIQEDRSVQAVRNPPEWRLQIPPTKNILKNKKTNSVFRIGGGISNDTYNKIRENLK